jgi:predicted aldo/keto reductase-like oxidoreductase
MTKSCDRDARGTRKNLEGGLRRVRTDVINLLQFHEISYDNDPDWVVETVGLAEALKAQKEGKVRFLGFTGHKDPRIHLRMLDKRKWDAVQMLINVCDYFYRSIARQVLPEAVPQETAPIGMKSLRGGRPRRLATAKVCSAEEAIRYALSQNVQ